MVQVLGKYMMTRYFLLGGSGILMTQEGLGLRLVLLSNGQANGAQPGKSNGPKPLK